MVDEDVPVLIVGGSLVGLSTAVFLGHHGVPSLVLERHRGTAIHPRAALVNQRSIETVPGGRPPGRDLRPSAAREFVQNGAIVSVECLGGRRSTGISGSSTRASRISARRPRLFVTQIGLEPLLLEARGASRRPNSIRHGARLRSSQDDDGVNAVVRPRDGGPERTSARDTSIAADGATARSGSVSASRSGHGSFSNSITIYFRADVRELIGDRNLSVIYVFGPGLQGFFRFSMACRPGSSSSTRRSTPTGIARPIVGGHERATASHSSARRSATLTSRSRSRTCSGGMHARSGRRGSGTAGCSSPATPLTTCRRREDSAETPGYRTGTTWPGSSHTCSTAERARTCSTTYDAERRPVGELTVEQAYTRYVLRLASRARQGQSHGPRRRSDGRARLSVPIRSHQRRVDRRRRGMVRTRAHRRHARASARRTCR